MEKGWKKIHGVEMKLRALEIQYKGARDPLTKSRIRKLINKYENK